MTDTDKALAFDLMCRERIKVEWRGNSVSARRSVKGHYATEYFRQHASRGDAAAVAILRALNNEVTACRSQT